MVSASGALFIVGLRGEQLLSTYPEEIARRYKNGDTLSKLANEYCPRDTKNVGINVIYYCLKRLISKDKLKELGKEHIEENSRQLAAAKKGIFTDDSKKLKRMADKARETKKLKGNNHKAGVLGVISRGDIPYERAQKDTIYGLMNEMRYIVRLRQGNTSSRWDEIADKVNAVFGNDRHPHSLSVIYNKYWKND